MFASREAVVAEGATGRRRRLPFNPSGAAAVTSTSLPALSCSLLVVGELSSCPTMLLFRLLPRISSLPDVAVAGAVGRALGYTLCSPPPHLIKLTFSRRALKLYILLRQYAAVAGVFVSTASGNART